MKNQDDEVVAGFGDEWTRFDQAGLSDSQRKRIFEEYFSIFPVATFGPQTIGADFGCGSGRWAAVVAPQVGRLICIDASGAALQVARRNLSDQRNCEFIESSIDSVPLADNSLDFAYSLGVLHHVPDTRAGIASCARKLKPGAPFLVYLYYRFDNRPKWFQLLWRMSDGVRAIVCRMPHRLRYLLSQALALTVYWPLAKTAKLFAHFGVDVSSFPLAYYRDKSFYVMRTDALDRFGTRLEQRFTRVEIQQMLEAADLEQVQFSPKPPHWCAVGFRRSARS